MANSESDTLCEQEASPTRVRFVSVELVYLLILASQGAMCAARVQYIQKRLAEHYDYPLPNSNGGNCSYDNATDDVIGIRIQSETALWDMWMSSLCTIIPVFTAGPLVAASDLIGRKPLLITSAAIHLLSTTILALVSVFNLPLGCMLISKVILGIFGDSTTAGAVCLAYIADSTTLETRAVKMAALELAAHVGWSLGKLLVSILLEETYNFTLAFSFSAILALLCLVYTAFPGVLLETLPNKGNNARSNPLSVFKGSLHKLRRLCTKSRTSPQWRLALLLTLKVLVYLVSEGVFSVATIIGLGKPFCWRPMIVGIYGALASTVPVIFAAILTKPLLFCFSEYWLIHLGNVSFIGQLVTSALAQTSFQFLYLATMISCLRTLPSVMIKVLLSKLVSASEQGTVFAALSVVVSFATATAPLIMNGIYSATVTLGYPRLVFYVAIFILGCAILVTGILQFGPSKTKNEEETELQTTDSCGQNEERNNYIE